MTPYILVVEDEPSIAETICYALKIENFQISWTNLGQDALQILKNEKIDLIILDVGLPDMTGFEVCKQIRTFTETPIIFLTARKEEIDRVIGLEIGGDDYMTKPFSPRELVARVRVILKRIKKSIQTHNQLGFNIDDDAMRISLDGHMLELTRYEFRLLQYLLSQTGRIFSREQIMDHVWETPESSMDRTVDTHIKMLRAKLRTIKPDIEFIKTHRGIGYSIEK